MAVSSTESSADRDRPRRPVDGDLAQRCQIADRAGLRPAQHRADPGGQLPRRERLGDIVVGSELEAGDAVDLLVSGGEDHDGHPGLLADRAAEVETVGVGELEVEDHEPYLVLLECQQTVDATCGPDHAESVALEVRADEGGDLLFVLDQQDGSGHGLAPQRARRARTAMRIACAGPRMGDLDHAAGPEGGEPRRQAEEADLRPRRDAKREALARCGADHDHVLRDGDDDAAVGGRLDPAERPNQPGRRRAVVCDTRDEPGLDVGQRGRQPVEQDARGRSDGHRDGAPVQLPQDDARRRDGLDDAAVDRQATRLSPPPSRRATSDGGKRRQTGEQSRIGYRRRGGLDRDSPFVRGV